MVKNESEKDSGEKKRRKVSTHEIPPIVKVVKEKEDVYNSVIDYEEEEAKKRPALKDAKIFTETCEHLRKLFDEIAALKCKPDDKVRAADVVDKRIEGSLQFCVLKKINRLDKMRIRAGREALHKEKLRVDSNRLQLQNLLYEADHLNREVKRCYQFKSSDEEIELVSQADFYAKAPAAISRPEKTKSDEHIRRLAQLEWELQQRKELDAQRKELMKSIELVKVDIVSKNERLDSLGPRLQDLLKATRPLQDALDMKIEKSWEIQSLKNLLPNPLYLLYSNMSAYAEACDALLTAMIEGDEDEAKQLAEEQKHDKDDEEIDEPDSDGDDNEVDVDNVQGRHHRKQDKTSILDQKRDQLFKIHPLSVSFTVRTKERKGTLTVTLHYLMKLGLMTVHTRLNDFDDIGVSAGDVVSTESILDALQPGDLGVESPNPRTKYQLQDLKIDPNDLVRLLNEKKLGKPYKWAQTLCGFDVSSALKAAGVSADLCQNSVPHIVKQIRTRWRARLDLYHQIHALENGTTDVGDKSTHSYLQRISSSLVQWTSISFEEYAAVANTKLFVDEGYAGANDLYYRAIVTRGSAKLECYICISCNYPAATPLWSLSLNWNGKHTAESNGMLREMEFWINSYDENAVKSAIKNVLAKQLRRTMSSLDIYLETESTCYSPAEFTTDKTFIRAFRGRQRSRPYKVVSNGSGAFYTQL